MRGIDFQPEMVGRENELNELQAYLDKAAQGQGNTIFISGEAGIGKTRLVNELKLDAQSRGFKILSGNSLSESLTPYMPFLDALRSGGLENLFAEESPKVEAIYLVTHGGKLIKDVRRKKTELSPDIFTSMLTAVSNFVKESLSKLSGAEKEGSLRGLSYEDYQILIEAGKTANIVTIITGEKNEFLIEDMREILEKVNKTFGHVLENWDGSEAKVEGIERLLNTLITSGKFDGIYYAKEDPKARRNLLFENISLGLVRYSQTTPTVLCMEDLQWADPSSLALMHYIARNTRKHSLLILGTYRPEDVAVADGQGHPLVETKQLMDREDLWNELELQRLSESSMPMFLSHLLGEFDFSDEFSTRIYEETEGNPLFVIQLVKFLVEESIIKRDNGTWRLSKNPEDVIIPSKIYNVITRRLNRLDEGDMKIVDYASVIGEAFNSEILAHALNLKRIELLERLRILEKTHKLIRSHDGNFKFDHAKIKEIAYDEIPEELKREYHSIVANSIETLNKGNIDEVIGDLAFHYFRCQDPRRALPYFLKAAERAKERFANIEAVRFYGEALQLEEDVEGKLAFLEALGSVYELMGDHERGLESYRSALALAQEKKKSAEILARIGWIHHVGGEYDESMSSFTEALRHVEEEGLTEEALALRGIGAVHFARGDFDRALEYYEKSLAMSEKIDHQKGIGDSLNNIGLAHMDRGDYDRAFEYFERSQVIREKTSDQKGIADSLNNIGNLHHNRGDDDRALEYFERSLAMDEKMGRQLGIAVKLNNIGIIHNDRGDYDRALEYLERSLAIREKIGDQLGIAGSLNNIGMAHMDRGDYDRALEYYGKAVVISERIGNQFFLARHLQNIGLVHIHRGDYDRAFEYSERSLAISEKIGDQDGIADALSNIGTAHRGCGDYDRALKFLRKGLSTYEKLDEKGEICRTYCEIAEVYLEKRELERAQEFSNLASSFSSKSQNKKLSAMSGRISGMVNRERELWKEATRNFEESIITFEDQGDKLREAESHYEFGLMWKQKGDAARAREHLTKAAKIFEMLNLERKTEKAGEALQDI